jgi:hypothetical protein
MSTSWVIPDDENSDLSIRSLLADTYPYHYVVLLMLSNSTNMQEKKNNIGAHISIEGRTINDLFQRLEMCYKNHQIENWVVVLYPGMQDLVNKKYNRILKKSTTTMITVSSRRSVLRDERLTLFDDSYTQVDPNSPQPTTTYLSWIFT